MVRTAGLIFLVGAGVTLAQTPCDGMRSLSLPHTTITGSESVPAGMFPASGPASGMLPARCRVTAVLAPSSDSHIEMELWLPAPDAWNGKFQAVGNGGWAGTMSIGTGAPQPMARSLSAGLKEGYAVAANDTGHHGTGGDASFALGHPEKLRDFADRAVHEMVVASKAMTKAYYGKAPKFSYWNGCSTGGRQALTEAQRFPEDFDGILAGAPANYWTHLMAGIIWAAQATHKDLPGNMPIEKLTLLHDSVIKACDALDGVKDGVLEDPMRCKFDPHLLQCPGADGASCLTAAQVDGAVKMYKGATDPKTGKQIYPGLPLGSELTWDPVNGLQPLAIAESHFRFVVFKDPQWNYKMLDFASGVPLADKLDTGMITSIDPNLKPFFDRGGKLLQYHGWNDQQISAINSVNYYKSVLEKLGGASKVSSSYRLFMEPGMLHCGGGQAPNQFNGMATLERWRESNVAPDKIVAAHVTNGVVDNTRPLCPYPQVAVYRGIGSTNDAQNFVCKAP